MSRSSSGDADASAHGPICTRAGVAGTPEISAYKTSDAAVFSGGPEKLSIWRRERQSHSSEDPNLLPGLRPVRLHFGFAATPEESIERRFKMIESLRQTHQIDEPPSAWLASTLREVKNRAA